jgi:hypothetical protein
MLIKFQLNWSSGGMIFYFRIRTGAKGENVVSIFAVFRFKKSIIFYKKIKNNIKSVSIDSYDLFLRDLKVS